MNITDYTAEALALWKEILDKGSRTDDYTKNNLTGDYPLGRLTSHLCAYCAYDLQKITERDTDFDEDDLCTFCPAMEFWPNESKRCFDKGSPFKLWRDNNRDQDVIDGTKEMVSLAQAVHDYWMAQSKD